MIEKNLEIYDPAIEIEKMEKYDVVRKVTEQQQEKYVSPKVEMKTVRRRDEQVFFNLFEGFPDTVQDTQVGANAYSSYTVML